LGQRPDVPAGFGLGFSAKGLVELDPFTLETGRPGVFAAGDAVAGTSSVIKAVASGRKAAATIDRFLGGDGEIDIKLMPAVEPEGKIGQRDGFAGRRRSAAARVAPKERLQCFCPVETGLDEDAALAESGRCLQCDLRLKIRSVKIWSEYLTAGGEPLVASKDS
jgi:formate dehydrogenase beta subunit